jgi:hypothetical protein
MEPIMAAMTTILIKDDASTPTEFALYPMTDTPNPVWQGAVSGVPFVGQPRFQCFLETVKSGAYKCTAKSEIPVMETLGASGTSAGYVAPPKVAYTNTVITTAFWDPRSTAADRANALKMHVGLVQGASSTTATGILDQSSAGSAWVGSSLPITSFFINMFVPN